MQRHTAKTLSCGITVYQKTVVGCSDAVMLGVQLTETSGGLLLALSSLYCNSRQVV